MVGSGTEKRILEVLKDNVIQYNSTIIILVLASVLNSIALRLAPALSGRMQCIEFR